MKKIISYSLFGSRDKSLDPYVFRSYLRGLYWNVRMSKLIYPDWQAHVELDSPTFSDYDNIFTGLHDFYGMSYNINPVQPLCHGMINRMKAVYFEDVDVVLCRDTDAITTYREAGKVEAWLESGKFVHGIHDNSAHAGLMGGLCGFLCKSFREIVSPTFDELIQGFDLILRGSDQNLLNTRVVPKMKSSIYWHETDDEYYPSNIDKKLWESNFCAAFIGSAGVNNLETYRFFKRFDKETGFEEIAKRYPKVFDWYE